MGVREVNTGKGAPPLLPVGADSGDGVNALADGDRGILLRCDDESGADDIVDGAVGAAAEALAAAPEACASPPSIRAPSPRGGPSVVISSLAVSPSPGPLMLSNPSPKLTSSGRTSVGGLSLSDGRPACAGGDGSCAGACAPAGGGIEESEPTGSGRRCTRWGCPVGNLSAAGTSGSRVRACVRVSRSERLESEEQKERQERQHADKGLGARAYACRLIHIAPRGETQ